MEGKGANDMTFSLQTMLDVLPALLRGTVVTLQATAAGILLALALGLFLAIARRGSNRAIVVVIDLFVTVIRSTPLLIQLYLLFYVLPLYGPSLSPLVTGVLGLGVHYSSYLSEVFRAGIDAVPKGQWEASVALQMPRAKTWCRIILPQAFRIVLPQIGNYMISMYKHASLLATITVVELLGAALNYAGETFRYLEVLTLVGVIYFIIGYIFSRIIKYIELKLAY
jgi:polar amino acid transport system permease protein